MIVETFLEGDDHRCWWSTASWSRRRKRMPGHVVGDGEHTIAQLVEIVNQDPRRGVGHEKVLTRLELDAQAETMLERAGSRRTSVPPPRRVVYLRSTANLSTGGTATDVTDVIHPDNRDMAVRAVRAIGLDVGGVDFLTPDITESYRRSAAASARSTRRPASACTSRRARARRATSRPGDRHAVPARHAVARPDRRRSPAPTARRPPRACSRTSRRWRLHAGPHDDRRRLHRRPAHGAGRHDRPRVRADGARRPADRRGGARDRARRPAARRHGRTGGATSARCSTCRATTSA